MTYSRRMRQGGRILYMVFHSQCGNKVYNRDAAAWTAESINDISSCSFLQGFEREFVWDPTVRQRIKRISKKMYPQFRRQNSPLMTTWFRHVTKISPTTTLLWYILEEYSRDVLSFHIAIIVFESGRVCQNLAVDCCSRLSILWRWFSFDWVTILV